MLQDLPVNERRIERIRERIRSLEDELTRITPKLDALPGGAGADKLAAGVAQIIDLQVELTQAIIHLERERIRIETEISALPAQQAKVITARYVDGMSWNKVAKETHYQREHALKIHAAALRRLSKDDTK